MENKAFSTLICIIEDLKAEDKESSFWTFFEKDIYTLEELENAVKDLEFQGYYGKISENGMTPDSYIVTVEW